MKNVWWIMRRDLASYLGSPVGYVVLAVDYRGSIGYGRDWRQGHFRDLGGRDYEAWPPPSPTCSRWVSWTRRAWACGA